MDGPFSFRLSDVINAWHNSLWLWLVLASARAAAGAQLVSASTSEMDCSPPGAMDGDRFSLAPESMWKGGRGESNWWWQVDFGRPRRVGAILQIHGDHDFVLRNAPRHYRWEASDDGERWRELAGAAVADERRLFRLHRLATPQRARLLRLSISRAEGEFPTVREVEFFEEPEAKVKFPEWIIVVNTTHDRALPGHGREFIPLARSCAGWTQTPAQQVWLGDFDESFVSAEPRPLCAFLSGNFKDWCEAEREPWRGTQAVLGRGALPLWASCGGAQGLAILAETGVDKPWDCPHCRDPKNPKLPIYTHIGHTAPKACGDYSGCVHELGLHAVRRLKPDAVWAGLPEEFQVMESHCGQIEWAPAGWELIAGVGTGTLTRTQCLRVKDRPIYAAQFHIEMAGTPENSKLIMASFLKLAREWNSSHSADSLSPRRRNGDKGDQ
jgi:hypothetical protein